MSAGGKDSPGNPRIPQPLDPGVEEGWKAERKTSRKQTNERSERRSGESGEVVEGVVRKRWW